MSEQATGLNVPASKEDDRVVTMSQSAFSALIGETKRETEERLLRKQEKELEELATRKAEEIAVRKVDEALARRDQENQQKKRESEEKTRLESLKKTADRMNAEFDKAGKKHDDFHAMVNDIDWHNPSNAKILACIDDPDIDNPGDVLHHIMKSDSTYGFSLKSPEAIKKKAKEISKALKDNEKTETKEAPPPAQRTKPSHIPKRGDGGPIMVGQFSGRRYRN